MIFAIIVCDVGVVVVVKPVLTPAAARILSWIGEAWKWK
jgi:hypothetical protein